MSSGFTRFLAKVLRQPTTYRGLFLMCGAFGFTISNELGTALTILGIALAGGIDLAPDEIVYKNVKKSAVDEVEQGWNDREQEIKSKYSDKGKTNQNYQDYNEMSPNNSVSNEDLLQEPTKEKPRIGDRPAADKSESILSDEPSGLNEWSGNFNDK